MCNVDQARKLTWRLAGTNPVYYYSLNGYSFAYGTRHLSHLDGGFYYYEREE